MIKNFYNENNIKDFFLMDEFMESEVILISKGDEFHLENLYFLIDGKIELFAMDTDHEIIKLKNLRSRRHPIGLKKIYKGLDLFYKANTKITLLKINKKLEKKLFNNFKYIEESNEFMFNEFMEISKYILIRKNLPVINLLKYIFEREMNENNEIFIDNNNDFAEKHKISKELFYKGIKKLEKLKEIKRKNKIIKVLKSTF